MSRFLKGFVTLESPVEVNVTAVYTSEKADVGPQVAAVLNTGLEAPPDNLIDAGKRDEDWQLTDAPSGVSLGPATVVDPYRGWADPITNSLGQPSRWISIDGNRGDEVVGDFGPNDQDFEYTFQFNLPPGCSDAHLVLDYLADDKAEVLLNGSTVGGGTGGIGTVEHAAVADPALFQPGT